MYSSLPKLSVGDPAQVQTNLKAALAALIIYRPSAYKTSSRNFISLALKIKTANAIYN